MDTLAVKLTVPPVGSVEDFHLPVGAPCRAHHKKTDPFQVRFFYFIVLRRLSKKSKIAIYVNFAISKIK